MTEVSLQPLIVDLVPYIATALGAVITGLAGWAVALLKKKTGINISDHALAVFDQAADTQAGKWVAAQAPGWEKMSVKVDDPFLGMAAGMVLNRIPEEATSIGMTPEKLKDMIAGKIGAMQAQALSTPSTTVNVTEEPKK